jgi:hypothetical protein
MKPSGIIMIDIDIVRNCLIQYKTVTRSRSMQAVAANSSHPSSFSTDKRKNIYLSPRKYRRLSEVHPFPSAGTSDSSTSHPIRKLEAVGRENKEFKRFSMYLLPILDFVCEDDTLDGIPLAS